MYVCNIKTANKNKLFHLYEVGLISSQLQPPIVSWRVFYCQYFFSYSWGERIIERTLVAFIVWNFFFFSLKQIILYASEFPLQHFDEHVDAVPHVLCCQAWRWGSHEIVGKFIKKKKRNSKERNKTNSFYISIKMS